MKKVYGLIALVVVAVACFLIYWQKANSRKSDEFYMGMAIQAAKTNPKFPFGAVIVDNNTGEILATGVDNRVDNPTFHGEMMAINSAVKKFPKIDWKNTTLYTTAEPCSMCESAIIWAGIPKVVFGTSIDFLKMHGWSQIDVKPSEIISKSPFYQGTITGGVLHEQTDEMFSNSTPLPALQLASHP